MEVRINKEIREYTESMFFGLSLRQFFFSAIGCAVSVAIYFIFRQSLNIEVLTWICVLAVAPFAVLGFMKYNGMSAEKFIWAWIKDRLIIPRELSFVPTNIYYESMKPYLEEKKKEGMKTDDKNTK